MMKLLNFTKQPINQLKIAIFVDGIPYTLKVYILIIFIDYSNVLVIISLSHQIFQRPKLLIPTINTCKVVIALAINSVMITSTMNQDILI